MSYVVHGVTKNQTRLSDFHNHNADGLVALIKNPPAKAGDGGLIPESGRSPGGGNGNPLPYSCLGNPMDRRAWWAIVHGVSIE